jgi:hypothetical protein
LAFGLLRRYSLWIKGSILTVIVFAISFLLQGFWIRDVIEQSGSGCCSDVPHNILYHIWPIHLLIATVLLVFGLEHDDERFYLSASPFLVTYATIGSYVGVLFSVMSKMKWWQGLAVIVVWWAIVILS